MSLPTTQRSLILIINLFFIMQDLLLQMKKGRSLQKLLGTELTAFLVMNKLPEKYTFVYSQNHLGLTHGLFPKEHV